MEGRDALGRLYLLKHLYNEAWRQFTRILEVEPRSRKLKSLLQRVRPYLTRRPSELWTAGLTLPIPYIEEAAPDNSSAPKLRVCIGTTPMGRPRARRSLAFRVTSDFSITDAATGPGAAGGARRRDLARALEADEEAADLGRR